jgi:hypothetical protein
LQKEKGEKDEMKTVNVLAIGLSFVLLMSMYLFPAPVNAYRPPDVPRGPRSDVDVYFYGTVDSAYAALKAGEVDCVQWSLTYQQYLDAQNSPDLCVASFAENGMMEYDIHNNYTIAAYPGIRSPTSLKEFRQAMACTVDKQWIIDEILLGFGARLDLPIAQPQAGWWNLSVTYDPSDPTAPDNYLYKYNMTRAAELFDAAGFVDTEPDGTRNYPVGWPGAESGPNMDPLIFYVRTEGDHRLEAGRYLTTQLESLDIPVNKIEGTSDVCFPPVMADMNYHLYTGGWSYGRYPTYLFSFYNHQFYYPNGPNYVTGYDENGDPNYPLLNTLTENIYYALTFADAQDAVLVFAGFFADQCVNIPLWSYTSFVGWQKHLAGVVNMMGTGFDNGYTFLNAYRTDEPDAPVRMATIAAAKLMNPMYAQWYFSYAALNRVYDGLMNVNPYNLATDQPWMIQDWKVETWVDEHLGPDEPSEKTKLTYYLRSDCGLVTPGRPGSPDYGGEFVRYITAHDLEFSCWYTYSFSTGWNWANYMDVHHTNIVDDYTIEYYFDDASYWFTYAPQYPIWPKYEFEDPSLGLLRESCATIVSDGSNLVYCNPLELSADQVVQVINATLDGTPLYEGVDNDFYIFAGYEYAGHSQIMFTSTTPLPAGTFKICYYTPDADPHGYFLAGLDWHDYMYSSGPFYMIDHVEGVGGYATFNRNQYFFLETPPLGELDWVYHWVPSTYGTVATPPGTPGGQPHEGYFQINIFDVVKAAVCYGHHGDGPFDPDYFPGADVDGTDTGMISIFDIVTVVGKTPEPFNEFKFNLKWGSPPPNPPP